MPILKAKTPQALPRPTDAQILSCFQKRDPDALRMLAENYGAVLLSIACRFCDSRETAEECVNDAYLRLWNAIPPAAPSHLLGYASKTVRNVSLNRIASDRTAARIADTLCDELAESVPDPDVLADPEDLGPKIDAFLRTLSKDARVMFVLRYFCSEPLSSISEKTGASEAKIKSSLFRSRKLLKTYLNR